MAIEEFERMRSARVEAEKRAAALIRLQEASVGLLLLGGGTLRHDRLIEILCHVTGAPRGALPATRPTAGWRRSWSASSWTPTIR